MILHFNPFSQKCLVKIARLLLWNLIINLISADTFSILLFQVLSAPYLQSTPTGNPLVRTTCSLSPHWQKQCPIIRWDCLLQLHFNLPVKYRFGSLHHYETTWGLRQGRNIWYMFIGLRRRQISFLLHLLFSWTQSLNLSSSATSFNHVKKSLAAKSRPLHSLMLHI